MKTAAFYCRVSTDNQEREGTSLKTQLEACLKYCQEKGYTVAYKFTEAYSGLTLDRPKINELRDLVRNEAIDVLVVYCLDRLTRNPGHGVIVTEELEKHNVTLEAVTEDVNTSDLGKLISYIRGFASKLEAEKIQERTTRGKRAFLQQGKIPTGCGKGIYGYKWDKENKRRIPLEYESKVVQRIFEYLADGKGYFNVARLLNEQHIPSKSGGQWSARTIFNIAGNPAYVGITYYGQTHGSSKTKLIKQPKSEWILLPDATPAIISKELFERVQEIRQQNRDFRNSRPQHEYVLTGHIRCAYCGSPMVGSFMNHRIRYYHCRGAYATAKRTKTCNAKYVRADYLENVVWQKVREVLEKPEVVLAGVKEQLETETKNDIQGIPLDKEIEKLKKNIKSYGLQEQRLIQLLRYDEIEENRVLDEINKIKADRANDEKRLENLILSNERIKHLQQTEIKLSEQCQKLGNDLNSASFQDKRDILDMLAITVTVTTEPVSIKGIIPIENTSAQSSGEATEATHHWTNIGMTTWT